MDTIKELPIEQLQPSRSGQPRHYFDEKKLQELAESIKAQGVIQPVVVRKLGQEEYEIIAGERRWRACALAQLDSLPCLIKDITEPGAIFITALTENIQREDLTPYEEASALLEIKQDLIAKGQKGTQSEMAKCVSKGRDWVVKTLSILTLSDASISYFKDYPESLHKGHAYALQGLEPSHQLNLIDAILMQNLSVRAVEQRAKKFKESYTNAPADYSSDSSCDLKALAQKIEEKLGCSSQIQVSPKSKKYSLTIETWGQEAFDGILEQLNIRLDED